MSFARPELLHLLHARAHVGLALIIQVRMRDSAMRRFVSPEMIERLAGRASGGAVFTKALFLLLGACCMLVALAGPRFGSHYEEVSRKGVDIMVAVDTSASMLVEDVSPNRLERAKREVYDLLRVISGDRIGLVAFSGAAYIQCPLTLDYAAIEMFVGQLAQDIVPVAGTDIGAAIETALSGFDAGSRTDKVIILITDGEDNEGRGLSAARKASEQGVKIFVFGIGEASGEPVPLSNGSGGFRKDDNDRIVVSRLDEEGLRRIAQTTGGEYVKALSGDLDLDLLYFSGIKKSTVETELSSRKVKVYHERFQIFVFAAFCLLLLEGVLNERRPAGFKA